MNKLKNKLNEILDLSLVEVKSVDSKLVFEFKNGVTYTVDPSGDKSDKSRWNHGGRNQSFIDPGFKILLNQVLNEPYKEDSMGYDPIVKSNYKRILQAFSKNNNSSLNQQIENYNQLFDGHLKEFFSKVFNLSLDPKKEFFLLGDDEVVPHFRLSKEDQVEKLLENLAEGKKVKIIDKSAYIFQSKKGRTIDLNSHYYMDDNFMYLGSVTEDVELEAEPEDDADYFVSFNTKDNTKRIFKKVLRKDVDLSTETNKLAYKKANGLELTLFKVGEEFFFKDSEGEISIRHPDLLIYLLE